MMLAIPGEWKSIPQNTHVSSPSIYLDHHVINKKSHYKFIKVKF